MGDMIDDFRFMKQMDRERKERNLKAADPAGWDQKTQWHWQRRLQGDLIDYWPSRNKWRWRGKTYHGSVKSFIEKREAQNSSPDKA